MKVLSQRNDDWKNLKLGNSDLTIGGYGCLVTSIASISNLTPDVVNEKLKSVSGYLGALVIWKKVQEAIPCLTLIKRGYTSNVPEGVCLVEVDFDGTPRTDDRHWVVYLGNGTLMDPWTGTIDPISKFPTVYGYANFKIDCEEGGDDPLNLDDKIPQEVKDEFNLAAYGEFNNNEETWRTFIEKWKEYVTKYNTCKDSRQDDKEEFEKKKTQLENEIDGWKDRAAKAIEFEGNWQRCTDALAKKEDEVNNKQLIIADMRSEAKKQALAINTCQSNNEILKNDKKLLETKLEALNTNIGIKGALGIVWKNIKEVFTNG